MPFIHKSPPFILALIVALPAFKSWLTSRESTSAIDATVAIFAFGAIASLAIWNRRSHMHLVVSKYALLFHGLLAAVLCLSIVGTPAPIYGSTKAIKFLVFSTLSLVLPLILIQKEQDIKNFCWSVAALGFFISFLTIFAPQNQVRASGEVLARQSALGANTLNPATAIALSASLSYLLLVTETRHPAKKLMLVANIAIAFWALFATGTRSFFLLPVLVAGTREFSLLLASSERAVLRLVVASTLVPIGAFFLIGGGDVLDRRIGRFVRDPSAALASSGRTELWYKGIELGMQQPLFGNGTGSFSKLTIGVDRKHFPHNFVIEAFAETGLLGVIPTVGLFVTSLVLILRLSRLSRHCVEESVLANMHFVLLGLWIAISVHWDLADSRVLWLFLGTTISSLMLAVDPGRR